MRQLLDIAPQKTGNSGVPLFYDRKVPLPGRISPDRKNYTKNAELYTVGAYMNLRAGRPLTKFKNLISD